MKSQQNLLVYTEEYVVYHYTTTAHLLTHMYIKHINKVMQKHRDVMLF